MLWHLQKLLSPEEAHDALDSNIECFHKASAIIKILLTSKVSYMYMYVQYMRNSNSRQLFLTGQL